MSKFARLFLLAALSTIAGTQATASDKATVCTITVNSPDEKEAFRRYLPADKYQFVELVEHGRSDWLDSACRAGVKCDVLVVSGHYDGGNEFFSDQIEAREFLPVDEMERASCSGSCSGLFSQLKEVYLFGCNTLNPGANRSASAEVARSLVRSGHSRADAENLAQALGVRHGESSRDRMRQVFKDVPVIYGFSSVAPLGPTAASLLQRHFQSAGTAEVGNGRPNARLLGTFAGHSMVAINGVTSSDPLAAHRQDVCQFSNDRLAAAQKVHFVHQLLRREMAEVRMFLDRIERYASSLPESARQDPAVAGALAQIAADGEARARYLDFARDADQVAVRARMLDLARDLGWLTAEERADESVRLISDALARDSVSAADVDQLCALNGDHALDSALFQLPPQGDRANRLPQAAILACLGNEQAHTRVLQALSGPREEDIDIAQVYLRHRPIGDASEVRAVTASVARMNGAEAKVRALQSLAKLRLADPESLDVLARLYPVAESPRVQLAIAGVLIRADYDAMDRPELLQTLRDYRLKAGSGPDTIDALIRRLEAQ
jgi:hypothetical protein